MKKAVLSYIGITYIICFSVSVAQMIISGFTIEMIFLFFFSLFSLIPVYLIFQNKYLKKSFIFLSIINFVQSVSFIFLGLTFKFIIGPDLTLYLIDAYDNFVEFSFKAFNIFTDVSYSNSNNVFAVGINFIHLFCSLFCFKKFMNH